MPKFSGQTGQVLTVQLKSEIVEVRWFSNEVALGGRITFEVCTAFVADGSNIKITFKDKEGSAIESVQGKMYGNYHRAVYTLTKVNKTGGMFFDVELPDHHIKARSGPVRVLPPIKISDLKIQDGEEKTLTVIAQESALMFSGKLEGALENALCTFLVYFTEKNQPPQQVFLGKTKVVGGKAKCAWKRQLPKQEPEIAVQEELNKFGTQYATPTYHFELQCCGAIGISSKMDYVSWAELDLGELRGKAILSLPDGSEITRPIPEDGILKLEKPKAGSYTVKDIVPNEGESDA